MGAREASDYHFQDETCLFISPKGQDFGLGVTRVDDGIHVGLADKEGDGAFVVLTDDQAATTGRELLRLSVGPVYESPEELAAEVARLREESARVGRCGAESRRLHPDGRAEPTFCALPAGHAGWHRDDSGTTEWNGPEPAPRDGDLTRTLRDAMKRYGVPAVMAEAGRLAQQRL